MPYESNERRAAAQRAKKKRIYRRRRLVAFTVLFLAAAAAVAFWVVPKISAPTEQKPPQSDEQQPEPEGESVPIMYAGRELMSLPGVAVNTYKPESFVVDAEGRMTYSDGAVTGIDVSSHQEEIDWQKVKADGVDFAMIRVGYRGYTEGKLNADNRFEENIKNAAAAGLDIGIYFYSQAITEQEALEEAKQVCTWLAPYKDSITYPVAFDWEYVSNPDARTNAVTGEQLSGIILTFCDHMKDNGYSPMIYLNLDFAYMTLDLSEIDEYPFWLAEYDGAPTFYYAFEMLQYTSSGSVDGVNGKVDVNLYFKKD